MTWQVIEADCVEQMKLMDEASVDAVVTDPPYGLEFMGKEWDRLAAKPRGRTATMRVDEPTIEERDDTPQHRAAVRQPAFLLRCERCGGNSSGAWNRCECEKPDFRSRSDLAHAAQQWHQAWATEALRVLKPGGHLLAFGGTRTYHRLACAIEDAGFEIRDSVIWLYGSGFPKSLDVSKAIDRAAGAERGPCSDFAPDYLHPEPEQQKVCTTCLYHEDDHAQGDHEGNINFGMKNRCGKCGKPFFSGNPCECPKPKAATPEAQRWQGFGTSLKPAHEPIVVARKPLIGTVAQNVERFGTGALAIDRCRIEGTAQSRGGGDLSNRETALEGGDRIRTDYETAAGGRWPANVALSHAEGCERVGERRVKGITGGFKEGSTGAFGKHGSYSSAAGQETKPEYADPDGLETVEAWSCAPGCPVAELDRQSGELKSGSRAAGDYGRLGYQGWDEGPMPAVQGDVGHASRFFYVAKSSRSERTAGVGINAHPT